MLFGLLFACNNIAIEKQDYIFPDEFSGWVFVEYEVKDAPVLTKIGEREQLSIPPNGILQTPNPFISYRQDHRYRTTSGTVLPDLALERLSYDEEKKVVRQQAFICCGGTATITEPGSQQRKFSYFYVGKGPAKERPELPAIKK